MKVWSTNFAKACTGLCIAALMAGVQSADAEKEDGAPALDASDSKSESVPVKTPGSGTKRRLDDARIRIEIAPLTGISSGGVHKSIGEYALRTYVDYEIPVIDHLTVAPRLVPLMYYNQNEGDDVWAGGFGVALRGYTNGKEHRGLFGEIGLHVLGQSAKFNGNSGSVNFLDEAGVGYMFEKGWHIVAKISHMSNANLARHNAGVNNAGIGFGYSFKRD